MSDPSLPAGWIEKTSRSTGEKYYLNTLTNASQWTKPTDAAKDEIQASHLLVKHRESRRPASWKSDKITRTKEEALSMIIDFRNKIASGEVEFAELARKESDCSSARNGGDLGKFGRNQMQKPFEEAAYNLRIGELSQPVHSDSGIHIILRTA
ncbi:peptidyl-prolyl cis-trans isomerase NIMA-interacting 1-like [Oscarella lobularis]|uniref:peptidyl-prolyl cis-trans isomerase NIMA-interacting 1-like n=1 Tax=Oscarella lobularis TaxID=121494 RepID=UPI003314251C